VNEHTLAIMEVKFS